MKVKKGFFIVLEGPDRSGKTTQAGLLKSWFEKKKLKVMLTREPGGVGLSEEIRKILLNPGNSITPMAELLLYEAARAQHVKEKILPALKKGLVVISDRFTMATLAYQGFGRGIDLRTVKLLNDTATQGLKPDMTVVFIMPDSEFKKRRREISGGCVKENPDRIEREKTSFRRKVNRAYRNIAAHSPGILKVPATGSVNGIHDMIKNRLEKMMNL